MELELKYVRLRALGVRVFLILSAETISAMAMKLAAAVQVITATNPIFVNGEWSYPPKLKIGDKLLTAEGKEKKIESIKYAEGEVKVYNLQVEKTKNYFAEDVLVHNKDDQTGKYVGI